MVVDGGRKVDWIITDSGITIKGGGSARWAAAQQAIEIVDGRLEAFYFAFGEDDVFAILEAPDNVRLMETCNFEGERSMEATMMMAFSANEYARRFIQT